MKSKYIYFMIFTACSLGSFAQVASVEFSGNLNPIVNSTVVYTAIFRASNGSVITNPPGSGGFSLIAGNLGTVVSSDTYSVTIQWTSVGSGTIEYGFVDSYGNHVFEELYVDVALGTTPPVPVAGSATNHTTTSFVANWNASTGATSYTLELSLGYNFDAIFRTYTGITTLNKSVTSLSAGVIYYYRVRAYINANAGPYSNIISAATIPEAPTGLSASSITQVSFVASWAAVTGAFGYEIDVSDDNFATFVDGYNSLDVNAISIPVTGLSGNKTYQWRVRTVNSSYRKSANSVTQSVTTLLPTLPVPVVSGFAVTTSNSFQVNWSSVSGSTGYQIDVSTDHAFSSFVSPYNNLAVTSPPYFIRDLNANTTYYVRIRAINTTQTSGHSATASKLTVCSAPVATGASDATSQSFKANWNVVSGATSYRIDVATNSEFNPILFTVNNISTNSYTVAGLSEKTSYYYRVRAVNPSGTSTNSNTVFALNFDHNMYAASMFRCLIRLPSRLSIIPV